MSKISSFALSGFSGDESAPMLIPKFLVSGPLGKGLYGLGVVGTISGKVVVVTLGTLKKELLYTFCGFTVSYVEVGSSKIPNLSIALLKTLITFS